MTFIENSKTIVVINYNYGTQFWTPMGDKINELKKEIYSIVEVINPSNKEVFSHLFFNIFMED